jgi:hypothetical protein
MLIAAAGLSDDVDSFEIYRSMPTVTSELAVSDSGRPTIEAALLKRADERRVLDLVMERQRYAFLVKNTTYLFHIGNRIRNTLPFTGR